MTTQTVGLIPSPDLPEDIVAKITGVLEGDLKQHIDANINWVIETEIDPLTGAAEYVNEIVEKAAVIKEEHNWDYAICLTDLPSFSNNKAVTADISTRLGAALISLPSFGAFPLKKRIRKALTFIMDLLYQNGSGKEMQKKESFLKWRFLFSKIKQVEAMEDANTDARFIMQSSFIGWLHVLSGMTFANRPWKAIGSFKKILTLAFATGTYISIFSTPWELSMAYTPLRFVILMLLSIAGMVTWLIFAHNLWEKPSAKSQSEYRIIYNITTIMTLTVVAIINYVTLFAAIMLSISLFVPPDLFEGWTAVDTDNSMLPFMRLSWLTTSLGLLAGAVGATAEKEARIRHITYSYRQLSRRQEITQQSDDENNTNTTKSEQTSQSYQGTKQQHREEETE